LTNIWQSLFKKRDERKMQNLSFGLTWIPIVIGVVLLIGMAVTVMLRSTG